MSDLPLLIKEFSRQESISKRVCATLKRIETLMNNVRKNCFLIEQELDGLSRIALSLSAGEELKASLNNFISETRSESSAKINEIKGEIGAELLKVIEPLSLTLSGNLPELQCGFLNLKFDFSRGGEVRITFGREREELSKLKLDIGRLGNEIATIYKELMPADFSETEFLKSLHRAYEIACFRMKRNPGDYIPITAVLCELSLEKQNQAFYTNPKRENFSSYSRVRFAVDMSRLKNKRHDNLEMRLTIATMEQTKSKEQSLWIPNGIKGDGTNFSAISFCEVKE